MNLNLICVDVSVVYHILQKIIIFKYLFYLIPIFFPLQPYPLSFKTLFFDSLTPPLDCLNYSY
jgi:hypothetical protein